ncbi:MAG: type I secretion system permease/ATPase [Acetobacteraceae bacterium]
MASPVDDRLATSLVGRTAVRGVLGVAGLALVCNVGALAVPLFNMQVFNRVLTTRNVETLAALATGLGVCLLAWAVLDVLRGIALDVLGGQITRRLSLPLVRAIAAAPRPDIVALEALTDLETLRGFISSPACMAPFDLFWTPVLLLVLITLHWGFAALGGLCVAILLVMNLLGDAVSRREMLAANDSSAVALRGAANAVNGAEVVLALGMLQTLRGRWQRDQLRASGLVHRAILRARAISATINALRMAMTGAMVALGLVLALNGSASGGSMVSANMILARLLLPFGQVAATRRKWADALASWRRIRTLLGNRSPHRYATALPAPVPRLVVEGLAYVPPGGDRALLRGISFTAEPGEAIAIIGPSSAGKSTLLRIILGMLPPTTGGVYLDGTSTYLWEREDFARHVGYVPQRPALLDETAVENIARMQAPDLLRVIRSAKRAGAHPVIAALPQGYSTPLAANILSGGQRQRVALARALYGDPRVLVLDEPTAFLDQDGEAEVHALLASLKAGGTTVLLVTHRPSLLAAVDKVLVLQDGAVAQFGPREEIVQTLARPSSRLVSAKPELKVMS